MPWDPVKAIAVGAVAEEHRHIAEQRCRGCGNTLHVVQQSLENDPTSGKHYDHLIAACETCQLREEFTFDISSFFGKRSGGDAPLDATPMPSQAPVTPGMASCLLVMFGRLLIFTFSMAALVSAYLALSYPSKDNPKLWLIAVGGAIAAIGLHLFLKRFDRDETPMEEDLDSDDMNRVLVSMGFDPLDFGQSNQDNALRGGFLKSAFYRGYHFLQAEQHLQAVNTFSSILDFLKPCDDDEMRRERGVARFMRALAYRRMGKMEEARNDLKWALIRMPSDEKIGHAFDAWGRPNSSENQAGD